MAKTFFGYKERDPSRAIDWNSIARDINDRLSQEVDRRETLKAELDEMTREVQEAAANAPMSKSTVLNQWVVDGVSNIANMNYTLNRELKAGRLDPNDFIRRTQRLKDGYAQIEGLATQWGTVYNEKLEDMLAGNSSHLERELMEFTEGLVNFDNSGIFTTDDGRVIIAKKERDANGNYTGRLSKSDVVDVNVLRGLLDFKADRYDLDTDMTTMADGFATKWIREKGRITKDDIRQNQEYDKAVGKLIRSRLENSTTAAMDVLMETGQYEVTRDPNAVGPNTILLVPNENGVPVPKLTDVQMAEAEEIARQVFETRLNSSITEDEPVRYTRTSAEVEDSIRRGKERDRARTILSVFERAVALAPDDPGFENVKSEIRGLLEGSIDKNKGESLLDVSIEKVPGTGTSAGELVIKYTKEIREWNGELSRFETFPVESDPIRLDLGDDIGNIVTAFAPFAGIDVANSTIRSEVQGSVNQVQPYEFPRVPIDPTTYSSVRDLVGKYGALRSDALSNKREQTVDELKDMLRSMAADGVQYASTLSVEVVDGDIAVKDSDGKTIALFEKFSKKRQKVFDALIETIEVGGKYVYSGLEGSSSPTNTNQRGTQQGSAPADNLFLNTSGQP
jgi:hypothetical protein